VEILETRTTECILQALSSCSIAHFAYHGVPSIKPVDSHLLLAKGIGEVDMLRVKDIVALKLPAARLAYLSMLITNRQSSLMKYLIL